MVLDLYKQVANINLTWDKKRVVFHITILHHAYKQS